MQCSQAKIFYWNVLVSPFRLEEITPDQLLSVGSRTES